MIWVACVVRQYEVAVLGLTASVVRHAATAGSHELRTATPRAVLSSIARRERRVHAGPRKLHDERRSWRRSAPSTPSSRVGCCRATGSTCAQASSARGPQQ
jgi:hypothetical protein